MYLDYLCNSCFKQYAVDTLLEIDKVVKECVDLEIKKQVECLAEYFSIGTYNYTESEKKYLEKILDMDIPSKERKELFSKYSLCFQMEEEITSFISSILYLFNEEDRTHARKQILTKNLIDFIQNLIDKKVSKKSFVSSLDKNTLKFPVFDILPIFLKKEINLFLNHIQIILNQNKIILQEEEIEYCKKQLLFIMYTACKEKTIEPPKYVLRNQRNFHIYQ